MTTHNSIEIRHNAAEIEAAFNALLERANNLSPVMRQIEGILADATERAFDEESSPNHDPWPDLKESTKKQRQAKRYWPGQILQRSGRLAASIETDSDPHSASIGTNAIYAAIHQYGADNMSIRIPQHNRRIYQAFGKPLKFPVFQTVSAHAAMLNIPERPFLGVGPEDEEDILTVMSDFLSAAF